MTHKSWCGIIYPKSQNNLHFTDAVYWFFCSSIIPAVIPPAPPQIPVPRQAEKLKIFREIFGCSFKLLSVCLPAFFLLPLLLCLHLQFKDAPVSNSPVECNWWRKKEKKKNLLLVKFYLANTYVHVSCSIIIKVV